MGVALLSQSKKSEFGIAQPSSCIAGHNVLNKRTASPTAKNSITERTYWSPALGTGHTDTQTHRHTDTHTQTAVDMEVPPELKKTLEFYQVSLPLH